MFLQNLKKKPTTKRIHVRERGNAYLRFFDRYIGTPLIFLLFPFKRKKKCPPNQINSIALLKAAGIGDTTLLSAIINDLKDSFPKATVTLFTGSNNYELGKLISHIEVVKLPLLSIWKSIFLIRRTKYSLWIDCEPWARISALYSFFSKTGYKMGFSTQNQHRHYLYDKIVCHSDKIHELENYRNLLRSINLSPLRLPQIVLPTSFRKKKQVVFHLFPGGSRAVYKMWKRENWSEVSSFLIKKGYKVILTGGLQEKEKLEGFKHNHVNIENQAGLSLKETAQLLASSCCIISVDTGIMHLATALSCHVIALHGPTSPHRWGGIGDKVISLTPPPPHNPWISLGFEKNASFANCMDKITPDRVKEAFNSIEDLFSY